MSQPKIDPAQQKVLPPWGDSTELIDADGRKLAYRPLNALEQSRLVLMVGAEAAANSAYMVGFVLPVASVRAINGEAVATPTNQRELDYLIQKLDDAGIGAVLSHMNETRKKAAEAAELQAKNS